MSSCVVRTVGAIAVAVLLAAAARADVAPVFGPQTIALSPRAGGMGEAGVALIDQYAAHFNPANISLYHIGRTAAVSFSPLLLSCYVTHLLRKNMPPLRG